MRITLNSAEQRLAKYIAAARHKANREQGAIDRKIGPQSSDKTDLEGIAAELAFTKLFNIYPDLETGGERPIEDAVLKSGETIDVKATKYSTGKLTAVPWKNKENRVDAFALMVGEFPSYRFAGFMSADELLSPGRLGSLGYKECYLAPQSDLSKNLNKA
jgi:hypothetical protein